MWSGGRVGRRGLLNPPRRGVARARRGSPRGWASGLWPAVSEGPSGRKYEEGQRQEERRGGLENLGVTPKVCALGSEALPWLEYLHEAAAADPGCAEGGPRHPGHATATAAWAALPGVTPGPPTFPLPSPVLID